MLQRLTILLTSAKWSKKIQNGGDFKVKKQVVILVGIVIFVSGFFLLTRNSNSNSGTLFEREIEDLEIDEVDYEVDSTVIDAIAGEIETDHKEIVFVDVQGEVVNPGVFEVESTVRVGHLIDLAGGLTDYASVRGLNRAARIYDEMVIFVGHVDDVSKMMIGIDGSYENADNNTQSGLISLSTASAIQLQTLPGIGPTLSANIIDHREANGAFSSIDELVNVAGIGVKTVENIREFVKP